MSTARRPRRDGPVRGIVPPHLLRRLAGVEPERRAAERTLAVGRDLAGRREVRAARARRPGAPGSGTPGLGTPDAGSSRADTSGSAAGLLPPHLAQRLPDRSALGPRATGEGEPAPHRSIHDVGGGTVLPGRLVRGEGEEPTGDVSADEAYDGLGATWELFARAFDRDSLDGEGLGLVASVHYGEDFLNAFWDGEQMVFGDGDGIRFASFTAAVDVIGHELTHGVVQYTAGLIYVAQPGALHESIADCFGAMVKQRVLGQEAAEADWLIGQGVFTDAVQGEALRSMKAPGTAYDDPVLGKDPQPDSMAHYADLPHDEANDNGGVHINSGIPNRAFYLAATGIGGRSWEGAGPLWYDALTRGGLPKDADFATFAEATLAAAASRHGADSPQHEAVEQAWRTVGVLTVTSGRG
jgi:Zn-dependent metalloprotease